ncbi:glycine-rich domain-containing protein [Cytobacillus firmus]
MVWLLLLAVVIWFSFFLRRKLSFKFGLSPKSLDIKPIKGLKKLSDHLEKSLSSNYMGNVEERVRKEIKLKENEYSWRLLDLKRYFIMTSFLKESPMFSEKIDDLWHQMLMFTREYDDFSKGYLGSTVHHIPNLNQSPEPDLRGFFDWVYGELFFIRKENIHLYKGFYRFPVPPNIIDDFKNLPENELIELYFRGDSQYINTVVSLISAMKKTAKKVKNYEKSIIQEMMRKRKTQQNYNAMLVPFLSVSYFHYDDFSSYMKISSKVSSSCTSCGSGSSCSSCSSSSCSSCSSCGGGGD